jgi:hypothetical protein
MKTAMTIAVVLALLSVICGGMSESSSRLTENSTTRTENDLHHRDMQKWFRLIVICDSLVTRCIVSVVQNCRRRPVNPQ